MFLLEDPSKDLDLSDKRSFNPLLATIPGCQVWYGSYYGDHRIAVDVRESEYDRTRARVKQDEMKPSWLKTLLLASPQPLDVCFRDGLDSRSYDLRSYITLDPGATLASLLDNIDSILEDNKEAGLTLPSWGFRCELLKTLGFRRLRVEVE